MDTAYLRSLKTALLGTPTGRLVLICNFEVEDRWARNYVGLPTPAFTSSAAVVQRMEELGVLLAGADDVLVLKQALDPDYLSYLDRVGLPVPTVLVPENVRPDRSTTEDALDSPALLARLAGLGAAGARLLPMGTSDLEQKLSEATGLGLAVPNAATFERVNSKIYSRRLAAAAGLRTVPGDCCESRDDLAEVLYRRRPDLDRGARIVVKDAFGVSGRGLLLLDQPAKADRLLNMVRRRAARTGDERLHVVVEEWLPKRYDLNYQVTVARDGTVSLDFVKQALTEGGVHKGHLMPAELTAHQRAELHHAAQVVGERLAADGYTGIAGVDAIVADDGRLYPVLEINARLNMSTYQGSVTERCQPEGYAALARHYPLRLTAPCSFVDISEALGPVLDDDASGRLVITCFGTVNADADRRPPFHGRLYTIMIAPDRAALTTMDGAVQAALDKRFPPEEPA